MGTKTNYWQNVWQERGAKASFLDPIKFDGFDLGPGKLCKKQVEFLAKKIKQSLNLNKNDVILEVGCGAGMTLGPISNFVKLAYGVDFADSLLTRAKGFYPELRLITGEANDLPFKDKMFDKVYSFSVFEYFPSLNYAEKAIKEMIRVLKPGGIIYINTPNYWFPYEGHYKIPFPTFLPKIFGSMFLKLLNRPTVYFTKNVHYITEKQISKILNEKKDIYWFRIFQPLTRKKGVKYVFFNFLKFNLFVYPNQEIVIRKIIQD